jgi:hypothetical protein
MKFAVWPSMNDPWHGTLAIARHDRESYVVTVVVIEKP